MKKFITCVCLLVTSFLQAADITIVGPTIPINPSTQTVLTVTGVTDEDLKNATAISVPSKGVTLIPAKTWGGMAILIFSSTESGSHTITVALNGAHAEWRQNTDKGLAGATIAKIEPPQLLAKFTEVVGELAAAYPSKSGSFVVTVSGSTLPVPPVVVPPTIPVPPVVIPTPPITTSTVFALVIRTETNQVILDLRKWIDLQPSGVALWEYTPDAPEIVKYLPEIPSTAKFPYVLLAQIRSDGAADIFDKFELPSSVDVITTKILVRISVPTTKVTKVTYVFEKDNNSTPKQVASALIKLNASGSIVATEFEKDSDDGTGDTPEQYKIALKAATEVGLPALVIQSGITVIRVIKNPLTEQSVMDAIK